MSISRDYPQDCTGRGIEVNHQKLASLKEEREQIEIEQKEILYKMQQLSSGSHGQFSKLIDLKKERKHFEEEAKKKSNRLELLRKEEYKIWRRIREVHRKTGLIKDLKHRNTERQMEKKKFFKKIEQERKGMIKYGKEMKRQINEHKALKKDIFLLQKQQNFNRMKSERLNRERLASKAKKNLVRSNQSQALKIKKELSEAKLILKSHDQQKIEKLTRRLMKERKQEKIRIRQIQKDYSSMCHLEEDWVSKLKNSKMIQEAALDKLKEILEIENNEEETPEADSKLRKITDSNAHTKKKLLSSESSDEINPKGKLLEEESMNSGSYIESDDKLQEMK